MTVDGRLVQLVDERFGAVKRQHFPSYLDLLKSWQKTLRSTEEWIVQQKEEFVKFSDNIISKYQCDPSSLQDHTYSVHRNQSVFIPHHCSEACWTAGCEVQLTSKHSSLSLPLLLGWRRVLMLRPANEGSRLDAVYVAPCGRRLRCMDEVRQFLDNTYSATCNIAINNFTFDPMCALSTPPFNARFAGAKVFIPDITFGREVIPITCVNCLTAKLPEHFEYIPKRVPGPGVKIESDPGFLVSCSCEDNCNNRSKCECWQLTLQEAQAMGLTKHSVGYVYGQLRRPQHSAIYECNSGCSCGPRCGNRVVQKGIQHHFQVFCTTDRGWGLRTLQDIPAGSFICTYVGQIFPEYTLEGQGKQTPTPISDEYFAELDYIEVMEHRKEGYESDVEHPSTGSSDDESFGMDISATTDAQPETSAMEYSTALAASDDEDVSSSICTPSSISVISSESSTGSSSPTPPPPPSHLTFHTHTEYHYYHSPSHNTPPPPHSPSQDTPHLSSGCLENPVSPLTDCPSLQLCSPVMRTPFLSYRLANYSRSGRQFTSPQIPISPHRLQGIKTRQHFKEDYSYIIDAKDKGNVGRYINHSCSPNIFVQNVFVDTHDLRFPLVAFFARHRIKALQELTWDYSYEVGSVEGKAILCHCKSANCRGRLL